MKATSKGFLFTVVLGAAGCAASVTTPASFRATYVPQTTDVALIVAPDCMSVRSIEAVDGRSSTSSSVGVRFSERTPAERYPIYIRGDTVAWLQAGADRYFAGAQVRRDPAAPVDTRFVLRSIDVQESALRRAEYDARVVLDVEVRDADSGKLITARSITGTAVARGPAGEPALYRRTLNRALESALGRALTDDALQRAFCGQPPEVARRSSFDAM